MLEIDSQSNLDEIKKSVSKIGKEKLEFDIIWFNFVAKRKITFLIRELLKKYNIEKYNEDAVYILMELISNAIKARYLHIIAVKSLRDSYPNYNQKIDSDEYFNDNEIMAQYSNIFKEEENKEKLKKLMKLEKSLIKDLDENNNIKAVKYFII